MARVMKVCVPVGAFVVLALSGCQSDSSANAERDAVVPGPLLSLTESALRAGAEIKMTGKEDSVLGSHPLSPKFRPAMQQHFELMRRLHAVSVGSGINYPRYEIELRAEQFCGDSTSAALLVEVMMRFDMESMNGVGGTPLYTASGEEHVFRFERVQGDWTISSHHEITLAEMHDRELLKNARSICSRSGVRS